MRNLFILRGVPGSGKSSWVKDNGLEPYTISADTIRLMYQSPITTATGELAISQNHDKEVWDLLFDFLERRMSNGELVIVDATHYKSTLINRYKDLVSKYRYRVNVVDFTQVSEEELKRRNTNRGFRKVPEEVIDKMLVAIKDDSEVKKAYKIVSPEEALEMINASLVPFDANDYEKIVVFGDIHGCYNPLKRYFDENPFNDNYNYIFCGDYLDRGIQNKETLEFLISLRDKKNCVFLEGNHECIHKDTDILTDKGWVNIAKLVNSQNAMNCKPYSYNICKDLIEVDTIKAFHKKRQDTMVCIETNNTKQVVSKNHEVLLGKEKFLAKDILSFDSGKIASIQHLIRPTSQCNHEAIDFSDDMLSLITWIVCDGTLVDAHKNKSEYAPKIRVQFKLSRLDKIQCLENLLNRMNITYTKKEATKDKNNKLQPYLIRIYSDTARKLYDIFGGVKVFPESFRNLDKHQLDVVLNSIVSTDGSKQEQRIYWYTNNQKNMDIIQEACVKNEYAFSIRSENKSGFKKDSHSYSCCITKHWDFVKNKNKVSEIPYDDYSYCITTENGTLITRIDGKVAITGNCWLRTYAQKDFDMGYYENRVDKYKDPFVTKVITQLNDRQKTLTKKINKNKCLSEELSKLLKESWEYNPDNREVYYQFERINVPERQKELQAENIKNEAILDKLKRLVSVLQHEEHSTKDFIDSCSEWFKETFDCALSLDITSILEKNYNVQSNRKDNPIKSLEFIKKTYPQIKDVDKAEIRRFCDRLSQMSYFTFRGKEYLVTHAGVPSMPTMKTATKELIKGVGKYEEHEKIDRQFSDSENIIQIHGHRNSMKAPVSTNDNKIFNLEGQVEFGGYLRVLEIGDNYRTLEIKNDIFVDPESEEKVEEKTDLELLKEMYNSKWVQVKNLKNNVVSFNFTRDAFDKDKWNTITTKARGLFVDKTNGNIVARSFDKFFNA